VGKRIYVGVYVLRGEIVVVTRVKTTIENVLIYSNLTSQAIFTSTQISIRQDSISYLIGVADRMYYCINK